MTSDGTVEERNEPMVGFRATCRWFVSQTGYRASGYYDASDMYM